jgi:hypothetical protein
MIRDAVLAILDGATHANTTMPWGRFGPILLPDDPAERAALVDAHLAGGPADVLYSPAGSLPEAKRIDRLALAAFTPGADGLCRWLGLDLDATDHGPGGLADPLHAARCLAERADNAGLGSGLLAARSRGRRGIHIFLLLPAPAPLADAVLGVAALAASAFKVAAADVADGAPHAFRRADGAIAQPGQPGGVELLPRSTARPAIGWPLALPTPDKIIDPLSGQPVTLAAVPRCDAGSWQRFIDAARAMLPKPAPRPLPPEPHYHDGDPLERIDSRTRVFLDGGTPTGTRNIAAFAAACNLLGVGVLDTQAERLILDGAARCGLPEHEARAAFASAVGAIRQRGRK